MAAIHFRMVGYITTMVMHFGNVLYMISCFQGPVMENKYVRHFSEMQVFFFTCWTFFFQTVYSAVALYSDIQTLKSSKNGDEGLPNVLVAIREVLFTVLVWPSTIITFTVYWSIFLFDRSLVYPVDIDLAIPLACNLIMHFGIAVASMWEVVFRSRVPAAPVEHCWRYFCVLVVEAVYMAVILGVYQMKGVWVYPFLGLLIGTIYFYLFFLGIAVLLLIIYQLQWTLDKLVWGSKDEKPRMNAVICLAKMTLNTVMLGTKIGVKTK